MPRKKNTIKFEESLSQLETMVENLDKGELSLEDSLEVFEKGIKLAGELQKSLDEAQQKVDILTSASAESGTAPFNGDEA